MNITSSATLAPKSYTWINVGPPSSTVTPASGGYTVTTPGQYIAIFTDGNFCAVSQTINVMRDTLRPLVNGLSNLPSNSYTLNCFNPTAILTATTSPMLPPSSYSWTTPPNATVSQPTISVSLANITTSPTNYTVLATGANGCVGRQKIQIYKDITVPPYTAVFTPSAITCANPCVAFSPGASTSTVPVTFTFTSPAPTTTATTSGALFCNPGTYTMTYMSLVTGCQASTVTTVPLNVTPPATVAMAPVSMLCGQTSATITAGTTTTSTSYSYTWDGPPTAGMSCPGGVGCYSTTTNMPGTYEVFILNVVNGCGSTNTITVLAPSFPVSFNASPDNGYAPLGVTFNNTTPFSSSTGTVTTSWSYGNGIAVTTTSLANTYSATGFPAGNTTYQSAGTYTVLLMVTQNSGTTTCSGTATAVVHVDLPSDLTVPNVFTPNGDGVNDNFTLLTTGLTDVTCTIFDRWGVKMYDVKSDKGNISWDGKNFGGKEVPEGTYFYILKATGADGKDKWTDKDGKEVKMEGTIRLYR
jgi:gliding motility-associated-like protein